MNRTTDTGILICLLVIILVVSVFGGHFAYGVKGIPDGSGVSSNAPGILGVIGWIWDSVKFFFDLMTFQVEGMPSIFSVIWLFILLVLVWILVRLIRGTSITP